MRIIVSAVSLAAAAMASCCVYAAQQAESLGQDLAATIALHGLPCEKVVASKRNSDSDYVATCQGGIRYHIFVDARGRVVVEKL